ncbi:unnamed protein product [Cunninghamella echinulata]
MDNMEFNWLVEAPKTDNNNNNNNNENNTIAQLNMPTDFITTSTDSTTNNNDNGSEDIVQYLFNSIDFSAPPVDTLLAKNNNNNNNINTLALSPQSISSHDHQKVNNNNKT